MDHNESVRKFEHLMLKQADHAREKRARRVEVGHRDPACGRSSSPHKYAMIGTFTTGDSMRRRHDHDSRRARETGPAYRRD